MTELLKRAMEEVQQLSPAQQDAIAAIILEELCDDQAWDEAFARSQDSLARIAETVRADIHAGRVRDGGWDDL